MKTARTQNTSSIFFPSILAGFAAFCLFVGHLWGQERFSYEGEDGFKQSFSLSGGQYKLYVYARDPIADFVPPGFEHCTFSGWVERVTPTYEKLQLGDAIQISGNDWTPWKIDREVTLTAGRYTLSIPSTTDCRWTFDLESKATQEIVETATTPLSNACFLRSCVLPPIALSVTATGDTSRVVSLQAEMVEFVAPFIQRSNSVHPSGTCLIKQGEKTLREQALKVDQDPVSHHDQFYVIETWGKDGTPQAGKITVEFVTNLGSSSAEFKVTK